MRFATLFSGGKDSIYALYYYISQGWEPTHLLTILSENPDSFMYHTPNIELARLQAESLGIKHHTAETPGKPETELQAIASLIEKTKPEALVSGAILSDYQKTRIEEICHGLGIKTFAPLWRVSQQQVLQHLTAAGFKTILTAVASGDMDESWLGRELDEQTIQLLSKKFNPAGEGGEFETFVYGGPIFKKPIKIKSTEKIWDKNSGYLKINI